MYQTLDSQAERPMQIPHPCPVDIVDIVHYPVNLIMLITSLATLSTSDLRPNHKNVFVPLSILEYTT